MQVNATLLELDGRHLDNRTGRDVAHIFRSLPRRKEKEEEEEEEEEWLSVLFTAVHSSQRR